MLNTSRPSGRRPHSRIIGQLRLEGIPVAVPDDLIDPYRVFDAFRRSNPVDGSEGATLMVRSGEPTRPPPDGFRIISTYDPARPWGAFEGYDEPILFFGDQPTSVMIGPPPST